MFSLPLKMACCDKAILREMIPTKTHNVSSELVSMYSSFKIQIGLLSKGKAQSYIDTMETNMEGYNNQTQDACCESCLPKFQKQYALHVANGKVGVQPFDFCGLCSQGHKFATVPGIVTFMKRMAQEYINFLWG